MNYRNKCSRKKQIRPDILYKKGDKNIRNKIIANMYKTIPFVVLKSMLIIKCLCLLLLFTD